MKKRFEYNKKSKIFILEYAYTVVIFKKFIYEYIF